MVAGIAEMLAMEMKSCGVYVSRSLSFKQAEVCCFILLHLYFCYLLISMILFLLTCMILFRT